MLSVQERVCAGQIFSSETKDGAVTDDRDLEATKIVFDGYSISFNINARGEEVRCSISMAALDALSKDRRRKPEQVLLNFRFHEKRICTIAYGFFLCRPESVDGIIRIWENDVDDDPINCD